MGKYKSLISNTILFAISTFGSKLLNYFLMPYYTSMLDPAEYGSARLIMTTCNLILPLASFTIAEAVIRFGLDRTNRKQDVYTTALTAVGVGSALMGMAHPLLRRIDIVGDYTWLIYLYVLASSLRTVTTHMVRSLGLVRLFALDGIFTTLSNVFFTMLFLSVMKLGLIGLPLATMLADALSGLLLFLILRLWRFVRFRGLDSGTFKAMMRYSIPLIPSSIFWWVTNASDQFFLKVMAGIDVSGVYTAVSVVPGLITAVSALFIQAWQISAFTEYKSKEGLRFYSTVFQSYCTVIALATSGLILLVRPIIGVMMASKHPAYYEGWRFVPFLLLAVASSCLVTFLGTIYNVVKKNGMVTLTTAIGAVLNLTLNYLLIPVYGALGAAFATFASYLIVFVIRAVDSRRYMKLSLQPLRLTLILVLLLGQTAVSLMQPNWGYLWQALILLALVACSWGNLVFMLRTVMGELYRRSRPRRAK